MEGISANVYKSLRSYWKRRGYQRLNRGKKQDQADPDQTGPSESNSGSGRSKRRFWRVKISPGIRFLRRVGSPKKWLTRLRDAYVKMMLNLANNTGLMGSGFGGSVEYGYGFGKGPLKEYDEKMIVEIYKSILLAQGVQLVPREAGNLSSHQHIISARESSPICMRIRLGMRPGEDQAKNQK